jgi:hypothetical protein
MLAQSHARKPAPPLAARGMWLRLRLGADAFGSALGDAVAGKIAEVDRARAKAKWDAEVAYYLEGTDDPALAPGASGGMSAARWGKGDSNTPTASSALLASLSNAPMASDRSGPGLLNPSLLSDAMNPQAQVGGGVLVADASGNAFGVYPADDRGFFAPKAEPEPLAAPVPGTMGPRGDGPDYFSRSIAKSLGGGSNGGSLSLWDTPVPGLSDLHGYFGQKIDTNFGNNWLGKGLNFANDFAIPATYGDLAMTGLGMVFPEGRALSGELKVGRGAEELAMAERGGARNAADYAKYSDDLRALQRQDYLGELAANGIKHTPENIVDIRRIPDGRLAFLETGDADRGLEHIMRHADDFAKRGVHADQIPDLVMTAVERGNVVGYQGRGTGRPIYDVIYNDVRQRVAVTVGKNGFIVGANPAKIKP